MSKYPKNCFECETGTYVHSIEEYTADLPNNKQIIIPNVSILRCDTCNEIIVTAEASKTIEEFINKLKK